MTKKQVATKSSGKGKNIEPSSSAVPIVDVPKAAKKKSLLAERGFSSESPSAGFISTVTALGWEKFVTHRKEYIATLVRDFYEGIQERNDGKPASTSLVRGEEIKFDARTINDYYGLGYFGKAIENKQKNYGLAEMNEVKARICIEDAVWEKSGELGSEFKILTRYLCDEANLWFRFIRHSLLPTSHTLFVDKERLLIIDAIMSRDKVEVGKLINREINKWQHRKDGNLYFPCLITDLCMEAGCEIEAGELREEPSGPFATKFKPRPRSGNASTSVDAQTLQRLVDQQNSLAKFVKEQFEWQKKIVAYVTKGKTAIQEPVLPDWMIEGEEEENEDDVPLSAMHLKVDKKEKAKRIRSPAKSKQGPAKKKQKKSSSEEELRSSELDIISDPDADESARIAEEVNSEEDEEGTESEERGSSSDKTDIQVDSPPQPTQEIVGPSKTAKPKPSPAQPTPQPPQSEPPTQEPISPEIPQPTPPQVIIPQPPPSKPVSPQKEQPEPTPNPEPTQDPKQPITQEEPQSEAQPKQQPLQEPQEQNVAASEAATEEPEAVRKPKPRVKHVMTQSPFGRKKRGASSAASEQQTEPVGAGEEVQQPKQPKPQKLQVKRKPRTAMGSPATATSGAFIATRSTSITVSTGTAAEHSDATASNAPEVEKAPINPAVTKETSDAELAKSKAWEEAKQRFAEQSSKAAQDASAASAGEAASEGTTVAAEEEAEKKKEKKKKKGAQSSQLPPRQSGRLRSGALKK